MTSQVNAKASLILVPVTAMRITSTLTSGSEMKGKIRIRRKWNGKS